MENCPSSGLSQIQCHQLYPNSQFCLFVISNFVTPNADMSGRLTGRGMVASPLPNSHPPGCGSHGTYKPRMAASRTRDWEGIEQGLCDSSSWPQPLDALWMQVRRKWPLNDDRLLGTWLKWGQPTSNVQISFPAHFGAVVESFKERKESTILPWLQGEAHPSFHSCSLSCCSVGWVCLCM